MSREHLFQVLALDDPRRCQGRSFLWDKDFTKKIGRKPCGKRSLAGSRFCKLHGGTHPWRKQLKGLYSQRVSNTLKAMLEDMATKPEERMTLTGEVDATRAIAERAVRLFDAAMNPAEDTKISAETLHRCMEFAQKALKAVTDSVTAQAKVNALQPVGLDAEQIDFWCAAVARILQERISDTTLRAKVLKDIESIKVPKQRANISVTIA